MGRKLRRSLVFLIPISLFFLLIGLLPIIILIFNSIQESLYSNTNMIDFLLKESYLILIRNSLFLSFIVSIISLSGGIFFGILFWGVDLPFKKLFKLSFVIPLIIPPYIYSICFEKMFYKESLFGSALIFIGFNEELIQSVSHGMLGSVIVLCGIFIPITSLIVSAMFSRISRSMIDAARIHTTDFKVIRNIVLPFSKYGLISIFFMIFLLTLGQLEVPSFFSFNVIPFEILIQFAAFYNYHLSMMASLPLFFVSLIIFYTEVILLKKSEFLVQKIKQGNISLLNSIRVFSLLSLIIFTFFLIFLPIGNLFLNNLSLSFLAGLLYESRTEIWNSIFLSFLGGLFLTIFGLIMALIKTNAKFKFKNHIDFLSIFSFIFPNIILGLALIQFWNKPSLSFFYSSFLIILFAYLFRFNIFPQRIISDHLKRLPRSIEEAGILAGAGKLKRIFFLILPNIKESIVTSFLLSFLFCLGEMGTTIFIYPPGLQTLPIKIFTMEANSPENIVSGLSVILILLILIPAGGILILHEIKRKKYANH